MSHEKYTYSKIFIRRGVNHLTDYQKMYAALFNTITDVIEILQKAQQTTEEMYISTDTSDATNLEEPDSNSTT